MSHATSPKIDELPAHTYRILEDIGFTGVKYSMETDNGWFTLDPTVRGPALLADARAVVEKVYGPEEARVAKFVIHWTGTL